MPGRVWYWAAGGIGAMALVAFVAILFNGIASMGDALLQMLGPGQIEISLDEPGTYTVFHEHESIFEGQYYSSPEIVSGLTVRVRYKDSGETIKVAAPNVNSNYAVSGRSGVGIFEFDIVEPGRYRITAAYANGQATPPVMLAIGHDFMGGLMATIFGAIGVMMVGAGLVISIAVITFVKREKALRAMQGGETT
jgi:hypothetical protein